ncbi:MAG: hypothetical protein KAX19_08960, partial [Candidatus Brocadiae bacterium]|nr:hypothetical protein [Candidatus Brocadiia bacterium]
MTDTLDSYGGFKGLRGELTGWFHPEDLGGRTWFVTPEGNAFFPVSLSHPYTGNSRGDRAAALRRRPGRVD